MAVRPGEDVQTLPGGKFFGYGVDSGMGCFIDAATLQALSREEAEAIFREGAGKMLKDGPYREWAHLLVDKETGGNLVVFSSGYGDGGYASYWGLQATGEPCCLVTDFAVLVEHQIAGRSDQDHPSSHSHAPPCQASDFQAITDQILELAKMMHSRKPDR